MNNLEKDREGMTGGERKYPSYVVVSMISAVVGGLVFSTVFGTNVNNSKAEESVTINSSDENTTAQAVAKKAMDSVVGIKTSATEVLGGFNSMEREVEGVGSGVIVSEDGYILTNSHVISGGDTNGGKITAMFSNGEEKEATVLWKDEAMDLAIIKVDATGLRAADLGDSDKVEIGEQAIAIGNPLGLEFERSLTSGVISGVDRSVAIDQYTTMDGLLQTDASINSGNSGGPLLNKNGAVVGINTLKVLDGEAMGFAIPINIVKPVIEQVIETGEYSGVQLGISGTDVERVEKMTGEESGVEEGVTVMEVVDGSPAAKAGIKAGDIITSVNGESVSSLRELKSTLYKYKKGEVIEMDIYRNGESSKIKVSLEEASNIEKTNVKENGIFEGK